MDKEQLKIELQEFMENEARSCSMDFGCITPIYVYRMWGGAVPLDDISTVLEEMKRERNNNDTTSINNNAQL
jgi:hypothetical protein